MQPDAVATEIRETRERLADKLTYDMDANGRDARPRAAASNRVVVEWRGLSEPTALAAGIACVSALPLTIAKSTANNNVSSASWRCPTNLFGTNDISGIRKSLSRPTKLIILVSRGSRHQSMT